jgi:hypothetical protein
MIAAGSWRRIAVAPPAADNSPVVADAVIPEGEGLRRAIAWLLEQGEPTAENIEQASQRFDLSPLDSAVLYRYFGRPVGSIE